MFKHLLSVSAGLLLAGQAFANDVYIDLNPDTFQARFDATHASNGVRYSTALTLTDDKGQLINAGLWTHGQLGNSTNVKGGLGGKIYLADTRSDSLAALALGGTIDFAIPNVEGLSIVTDLFYAPSMTISSDFKNLSDLTVRVVWDLFENGSLYAGVRSLQADYDDDSNYTHKFDNGMHAGMKITF